MEGVNLMNRGHMLSTANAMNVDGKSYYSKQLDEKFASNVFTNEKQAPAGARIQKKAYRANT